jgi:basic amino acid/polyamine antiporter, APA family
MRQVPTTKNTMLVSPPADTSASGRHAGRLLRIVGFGFGIAVGVGATIGSGILRTPGEVAGHMGTAWLTVAIWLVGGVFTILCSSSVIELITMLPRAGGWYVFSERAFGKRIGFVVGCCDWMNITLGNAVQAVALGEFAAELHTPLSTHVTLIAIAALSALGLLNLAGLKTGSRTQAITSLTKAFVLIALVIGCFAVSPSGEPSPTAVRLPGHSAGVVFGWLLALQAVVFTYDAWYTPMYFAEEDKNPARNLSRSIIGTVLSCVAIFLLINVALIHVLGMNRLTLLKVPVADASVSVFGSYGGQVMLLTAAITVISGINSNFLTAPRILYGMARDRLLPRRLTTVNQGGTPGWALIFGLLVGVALILSGTLETLIAMDSVVIIALYVSGFASLLMLRRREPHLPRPYRAWCYPWSTIAALTASLGFLLGAVIGDLKHSLFTFILVLLSYLASRVIVRTVRIA